MIENIIRVIFSCIFLLFALVQWNDPDPLLWMINYLIATILSIKFISKISFSKWIFRVALGFIGIYHEPYHEELFRLEDTFSEVDC